MIDTGAVIVIIIALCIIAAPLAYWLFEDMFGASS